MKKNNKKGIFSKGLIVLIVIMIVGYTLLYFTMLYFTDKSPSDVLTTCWFTFWSIELVNLVVIKRGKLIKEKELIRNASEFGQRYINPEDYTEVDNSEDSNNSDEEAKG